MPISEATVLDLKQYALRHVGPKAIIFPTTPAPSYTLLNRSDLVSRPLPVANVPNSVDFASGGWTGRLNDAGEANIDFPNKEASDGVPWRNRFDPTNKLQWLEIYVDEYLESVTCITKVTTERSHVKIEGYDGLQMCKSAYVRDWTVVQAPRDVIERGTSLWTTELVDDFSGSTRIAGNNVITPFGNWSINFVAGYVPPLIIPSNGGLRLNPTAATLCRLDQTIASPPNVSATTWSAQASFSMTTGAAVDLGINEDAAAEYFLHVDTSGKASFSEVVSSSVISSTVAVSVSYDLLIESDGTWVWGFANGELVGCLRRTSGFAAYIKVTLIGAIAASTVSGVSLDILEPFLQRGTDKGDYVLPGAPGTYPTGGLHARYFNDLDLQSDPARLLKIMSPPRRQAYAGSGGAEYANQQDANISVQRNPLPGAATSNWSATWFGAIYLKMSAGNYTFQINTPAGGNSALRAWVGKTKFGDQALDDWVWQNGGGIQCTVTAASLTGTLGYGGGTVARDGWYSIKVEYAVDATALVAPQMFFWAPVSYTDPGGTVIPLGPATIVPPTSLSPLGMVDQRFQGTSHFDLIQKTATAYNYQFSVEPKSLESGLFPGVLAPRVREGHDTDVILEPDDSARREGMINYSSLVDGIDQASSVQGNGAGFQNGTTGQLQASVYDPATLQNALFNMQAWSDNADVSYPSLLQAMLNSQLNNRLTPWQVVSGDPVARMRQAYTWPLPGVLSQMRWRPGDGLLVRAADINVFDTVPRQLLLVTRQILPNGVAGTQVGFAARPKSSVYANRQALAAALRPQRNYQKQLVTLTGSYPDNIPLGAGYGTLSSGSSLVSLTPGDTVVRARLRIAYTLPTVTVGANINGTDVTLALNGPWSGYPVNIEVTQFAKPDNPYCRLFVYIVNQTATASAVSFQILVDVLR